MAKAKPQKKSRQYLPTLQTLIDVIKRHLPDEETARYYNGENAETKRLDALASKRRTALLRDKELVALNKRSAAIKAANKKASKKKRNLKWDLINRVRLKGVTPEIVDRVYRLLGLDKEKVTETE